MDAGSIVAIVALATCLAAAIGGLIYFGKVAFVAKDQSSSDRSAATAAAKDIATANANVTTLKIQLDAANARVIALEKAASDANVAPAPGHGLDVLRGLDAAAGGAGSGPGPHDG
jgi:hypothetical protein